MVLLGGDFQLVNLDSSVDNVRHESHGSTRGDFQLVNLDSSVDNVRHESPWFY